MIADSAANPKSSALRERLRSATIGRFDIYAELGRGGMAAVFLALDLSLDRKVAIKVLLPELAAGAEDRFRREARVAASLSHPHIIPIYGVGDSDDLAYFIMKYVEGRSLDSVVKSEGPQSPQFVHAILQQMGAALDYAHTRGITHRDVKPANIMLDEGGWALLADFGIAKAEDGLGLTTSGMIIGTPNYMSPEHFNDGNVGAPSDQYALGILAFELLTGRLPFTGKSVAELMKSHLLDAPPAIRRFAPSCPESLANAIKRMLSKNPEQRFPTLSDAMTAIGALHPGELDEVRTQIIQFARSGSELRPRISVPISPVPDPALVRKRQSQTMNALPETEAQPVRLARSKVALAFAGVVAVGTLAWVTRPQAAPSKPQPERPAFIAPSDSNTIGPSGTSANGASTTGTTPTAVTKIPAARTPQQPLPNSIIQPTAKKPPEGDRRVSRADTLAKNRKSDSARTDNTSGAAATTAVTPPAPETTATLSAAAPVPVGPATIRIGTHREDAFVFINGANGQRLPSGSLRSIQVLSGEVRVKLWIEGCDPWTTVVTLKPGETTSFNYPQIVCKK